MIKINRFRDHSYHAYHIRRREKHHNVQEEEEEKEEEEEVQEEKEKEIRNQVEIIRHLGPKKQMVNFSRFTDDVCSE